MSRLLRFVAFLVSVLGACNYTEGQCWIDGQGVGGGEGGGPIVPYGGGGYGDVPPKPQSTVDPPPPDCNIVPDTPCNEKCLADYQAAAAKCGTIESDAERKTCQDAAYKAYSSCRDSCKQKEEESCTDMFDACQAKGYPCTRQIDKKKTLCAFCLADCRAERPYKYSECYQCGFK